MKEKQRAKQKMGAGMIQANEQPRPRSSRARGREESRPLVKGGTNKANQPYMHGE